MTPHAIVDGAATGTAGSRGPVAMTYEAAMATYEEFGALLAASGAPVAHTLHPPHPDPAAAVERAIPGHTLPDELVAWWAWHDGTGWVPGSAGPWRPDIGPGGGCFRPLDE